MLNRRGFTITEVMVAVALVGIAILGTFNVMSYFKLQYNKNFMLIDSRISGTLGERTLSIQLKNAFPSFNNLLGPDVLDAKGRNFFDLNTDYPANLRPEEERVRTIELSRDGKTVTYFIVADSQDGPPLYIDPVKMYNVSAGNATTSGTITYAGPLLNNYLPRLAAQNAKPGARSLWRENNLLYFYLPVTVRAAGTAEDAFVPNYCFFGRVSGNTIVPETFGGLVGCQDIINGQPITSLDSFLQSVPPLNGGVPIILMRSVSVLKYRFIADASTSPKYNLVFSRWVANGFDDARAQIAATDLESVTFKRSSVADVGISISVIPRDPLRKKEDK